MTPERPCSRCGGRPARWRQRWCAECARAYKAERRRLIREGRVTPKRKRVTASTCDVGSAPLAPGHAQSRAEATGNTEPDDAEGPALADAILGVLRSRGRIATTPEIAAAVTRPESVVRAALVELAQRGAVRYHRLRG